MLFHVERIQPLLSIALGTALVAVFRVGADWISPFLRLQPLPGLAALVFVWASLDLRLRLGEREDSQAAFELKSLALGSALHAEAHQFSRRLLRILLVASCLLLPTWGMPGALSAWLALLGPLFLATALLDGGTQRCGTPDLFLGLCFVTFWIGTSGLAIPILDNRILQVASVSSQAPPSEAIVLAVQTSLSQILLAIAIRLALLSPRR